MKDKRVSKTKTNIQNVFFELLKKKSFDDITIKEICEKALISRSTFYDHYEDLPALIKSYDKKIVTIMIDCLSLYSYDTDATALIDATFQVIEENRDLFSLFFNKNSNAKEIYIQSIRDDVVSKWLRDSDLKKYQAQFMFEYFMECEFYTLEKWFYHPSEFQEQEYKEFTESLLKYGVYQYLYTK